MSTSILGTWNVWWYIVSSIYNGFFHVFHRWLGMGCLCTHQQYYDTGPIPRDPGSPNLRMVSWNLNERPPKPPTIRNSFTRTLVPDTSFADAIGLVRCSNDLCVSFRWWRTLLAHSSSENMTRTMPRDSRESYKHWLKKNGGTPLGWWVNPLDRNGETSIYPSTQDAIVTNESL